MVKYGTTSNFLPSILREGLLPQHEVGDRRTESHPGSAGVFVGSGHVAMIASYAKFCDTMRKHTGLSPLVVVGLMMDKLKEAETTGRMLSQRLLTPRRELLGDYGVPVIINASLGEDVRISADGAVTPGSPVAGAQLISDAGRSWNELGTCALLRNNIPPEWFLSIEHVDFSWALSDPIFALPKLLIDPRNAGLDSALEAGDITHLSPDIYCGASQDGLFSDRRICERQNEAARRSPLYWVSKTP